MKHDIAIAAATDIVTLAEVKENLGIPADDTAKDNLINTVFIPAARRRIEQFLGMSIVAQTWKLTIDVFPDEIELERQPVATVDSITYYDTDGNQQVLANTNYYLDNAGDTEKHWIVPAANVSWPDVQDRINAVEVQYTTKASTDEQIKIAAHLIVGFMVNQPNAAQAGISDSRQVTWILRDTLGHLREVAV